jgi:hydroxymethylglutaryl-CoA lyase
VIEMAPSREEPDVLVSEVGPRDGLQSIKRTMPTEAKLRWIAALAGAGLGEIEVASFVSPRPGSRACAFWRWCRI